MSASSETPEEIAARKKAKLAKRLAEAEARYKKTQAEEEVAMKIAAAELKEKGVTVTKHEQVVQAARSKIEKSKVLTHLSGLPGVDDGVPLFEYITENFRDVFVGVKSKINELFDGTDHKGDVDYQITFSRVDTAKKMQNYIGAENYSNSHKNTKIPVKSSKDTKLEKIESIIKASKSIPAEVDSFAKELLKASMHESQKELRCLIEKYLKVKIDPNHELKYLKVALEGHPGSDDGIIRDSKEWVIGVTSFFDEIAKNAVEFVE